MKRNLIGLGLLLAVVARGQEPLAAADPNQPLSLQECLALALENNRKIDIADRRVLIEKDRRLESIGLVLPRVTGEARYSVRNNDQGFEVDDEELVTGERELGTATVSLIVPIYDFGGARSQIRAQNGQIRIAEYSAQRERQDLELAVTQAYFRILEARKIKEVVEESMVAVEQQLKVSQDYFQQGIVAKNDLLVAEVQLARRQQERIQAENNIALATSTLNRLIGLPVTRTTEVADVLALQPWSGSLESLVQIALDKRPDLQALDESVAIAKSRYKTAKSAFLPGIFGFGNLNYTSDGSTLNPTWLSGGIGVRMTFLDASAYARIRQQKRLVAEATDQKLDRIDDAVLEVQRAYLNVREATQRLPVAQKSIDQAEENLRITRDRYREGLISSADVLVEEERFAQARSDYYGAQYDYHQAFAEMVYTLGANPPASENLQETKP